MSGAPVGLMASGVDSQVVNLLTANQQTGGETLTNTTGFSVVGASGASIAYATDQYHSGAGSIKATCDGTISQQGVNCVIAASTLPVGTATLSFWYRVSVTADYTWAAVNNWDGTWSSGTGSRTAGTWYQFEVVDQSVSSNARGQITYLRVFTLSTTACSIWMDDCLAVDTT